MKDLILNTPLFGISLSFIAYFIGNYLQKKTKSILANPLVISYILIIVFLMVTGIPLSAYNEGGAVINMFLAPVTAVLALSIYRQRKLVAENMLPLLAGTLAGSVTNLTVVYSMSKLLCLEDVILRSLLSKGITTALAVAVTESLGGIQALTILAVMITGLSGNIFGPLLLKVFKIKRPEAQGIALGTSSHAIGTSKALEIGERQGALSSVALAFTGIITTLLALIIF